MSVRTGRPSALAARSTATAWLRAGEFWVAASILLLLVMQVVSGVWFPPPISVSQYGIGGWGWLFSLWAISLAAIPICLLRAMEVAGRRRYVLGSVLIYTGAVGALVMAVVRTQAGGDQVNWNAKVHMLGSIVASVMIPFGILAVVWTVGRGWRAVVAFEVALVAVALVLLLMAAGGLDTAGLGRERSWAFWQMVAVLLSEVMFATFALAARRVVAAASPNEVGRKTP